MYRIHWTELELGSKNQVCYVWTVSIPGEKFTVTTSRCFSPSPRSDSSGDEPSSTKPELVSIYHGSAGSMLICDRNGPMADIDLSCYPLCSGFTCLSCSLQSATQHFESETTTETSSLSVGQSMLRVALLGSAVDGRFLQLVLEGLQRNDSDSAGGAGDTVGATAAVAAGRDRMSWRVLSCRERMFRMGADHTLRRPPLLPCCSHLYALSPYHSTSLSLPSATKLPPATPALGAVFLGFHPDFGTQVIVDVAAVAPVLVAPAGRSRKALGMGWFPSLISARGSDQLCNISFAASLQGMPILCNMLLMYFYK